MEKVEIGKKASKCWTSLSKGWTDIWERKDKAVILQRNQNRNIMLDMIGEIIRLIVESLLGGTLIVTLVTLRAKRKRANEEAKSVELDNNKKLLDSFNEYIVEPIKKEVNALRKDVRRLNRAIEKINDCPHAATCPVRNELQNCPDDPADCTAATSRSKE